MRRLGKTDIEISAIGLGCWQFSEGKGIVGGYWPALEDRVRDEIVAKSLAGGINWFDTAEAYGNGRSERALSSSLRAARKSPGSVIVATKWNPFMRTAGSIKTTIADRLACLDPFPIDLHQVHQPFSFSSVEAEMDEMAALVAEKKIRSIGVSNFDESRTRRAHAALASKKLVLASNQVRYSLLDRRIEQNGVLKAAKDLGVTIIAYSPLEQGLLSGKFHDDPALLKQIHGMRKMAPSFRSSFIEKSRPLIEELKRIAAAHGSTPSIVALAWLVRFHGDTVVAIPGATKGKHVEENVGGMNLELTRQELDRIDTLSRPFLSR